MMRHRLLLVLLVGLGLVACRAGELAGPTPFPTAGPTATPPILTPIALLPQDLAAAPAFYRDVPLRLSGNYRRGPLLVCDSEVYRSPATWSLEAGNTVIQAGGYDAELRSLLPDSMSVTVEGRWRYWQGLVGCGKQAQQREIWYLEVNRIISPSPLVRVTLTPGGPTELAQVGEQPTPMMATPAFEETPSGFDDVPPPVATDDFSGYPAPPQFPEATDEPTEEPEDFFATPSFASATPSLEPTPPLVETPTSLASTPLPNASSTPTPFGQATATPTNGQVTPTATTIPGELPVVDQGDVFDIDEEYTSRTLAVGTAHRWSIELFEDEAFTVSVIAAAPADLVISLVKDGEILVNKQNMAAAGQAETVTSDTSYGEGPVEIIVQTTNGSTAEYAIVAFYVGEYTVKFMGFLNSGAPQSNVQMAEEASHYWFFVAGAGSRLSAILTPDAGSDLLADFYGPGAEYLEMADEGLEGEAEQLTDFPIPATGLHSVRVSDIEYTSMTYTIVISLE